MKCRTCRAEISFVEGFNGRPVPVQRVTQVYTIVEDAQGTRRLEKIDLSAHGGTYWISHFQTCPDAGRHSRRSK